MAETPEQKAQREAKEQQQAGVSPAQIAQLMAMIKSQNEQIQQLKQMQIDWKEQYEKDRQDGIQLQTVTYEDARARQEEEARRLALEISRETHSAANTLRKKIKHKLTGETWDFIAPALVATYRLGKSKAKKEEIEKVKADLKALVVDPRFRIQSTTWPDIEKALDSSVQTGVAALTA